VESFRRHPLKAVLVQGNPEVSHCHLLNDRIRLDDDEPTTGLEECPDEDDGRPAQDEYRGGGALVMGLSRGGHIAFRIHGPAR
jgi:hypothetical protein